MNKFWNAALAAGGLGTVGAFVFYSLYKDWLRLPIFSQMTQYQTFLIMSLFLGLVFAAYVVAVIRQKRPLPPAPPITETPSEEKEPTPSINDYLIISTVADPAYTMKESSQTKTPLPNDATVGKLASLAKSIRAISRLQSGVETSVSEDDISDPVMFDWMCARLPNDLPVSKLEHGRIVFAIFDAPPDLPAEACAFVTKSSVEKRPDVREFLYS